MTSRQLTNYLKRNRKRLALSQDDVAFLLGTQSGAKACRYERFVRVPSLETALAYEAIFQKPVRELFGGLYEKVEQEVAQRAETLAVETAQKAGSQQMAQKLQALKAISAPQIN